MSGHYILEPNPNGFPKVVPCDLMTWARWMDDAKETRRVARTELPDGYVSTVFLGLDHAWGGGPPILFETMIFGGDHNEWMDRYSTWQEAVTGHDRVVAALAAGKEP